MKNRILSVGLAALIVTTAIAGVAQARGDGPRERASFEELDTNGDGAITMEEMQARGDARFAATDTNSDGLLSAEEMMAASEKAKSRRVERMISKLDANDDGQLSMEEFQAARGGKDKGEGRKGRGFERLDTDGNGSISKEEFEAAKAKMGKRGNNKPKAE